MSLAPLEMEELLLTYVTLLLAVTCHVACAPLLTTGQVLPGGLRGQRSSAAPSPRRNDLEPTPRGRQAQRLEPDRCLLRDTPRCAATSDAAGTLSELG